MKIHDVERALHEMGTLQAPRHVTFHSWRYFMPFAADYHATALCNNYLPRFAAVWSTLKPDRYMVTGILLGTSESYALHTTKHYPSTIVACDYDIDAYNKDRNNMAYAYRNITHATSGAFPNELVLVRADSKKTDLHSRLGPYDLIFVDGEHGYSAVKADLDTAQRCIKPGGVVMVHDIALIDHTGASEVNRGYEEWNSTHDQPHIEIADNYFQLGLGLIQF